MLPEIKPFDRQVTLVGDSGIQFMDFGLTLGREQAGEFVELASGVLTRLLYNEEKDFFQGSMLQLELDNPDYFEGTEYEDPEF